MAGPQSRLPSAPAPDPRARVLARLIRWRSRLPGWRLETLGVLAATEADGVAMLDAAIPHVDDPELRELLSQHVHDESRHARAFAERLAELEAETGVRRRALPPAHSAGELSTMEFLAYLEINEARAAQVLDVYRELFAGDPSTLRILDGVVEDERFHQAYTCEQLERWSREGLADEVARARRWARRVDRQAFRSQLLAFLGVAPRLLLHAIRLA